MGYGDNIMATGMARGANERGTKVAFGQRRKLKLRWDHNSEPIFRYNPNVAHPGQEGRDGIEWVEYYKGNRLYNIQDGQRWRWLPGWTPKPGEIYLDDCEIRFGESVGKGFAIVEPNVPNWKVVAPNKQWELSRFQAVADELQRMGREVIQLSYGEKHTLQGVRQVETKDFRHAVAVIHQAAYVLLPEGGLHHAAAARTLTSDGYLLRKEVPGVVIFGGFIPPSATGYAVHKNVTGGAQACGRFTPCEHCREAMDRITIEEVLQELISIEARERDKWTSTSTASSVA